MIPGCARRSLEQKNKLNHFPVQNTHRTFSLFGPSSISSLTLSVREYSVPTRVLGSCVQYRTPGHADIENCPPGGTDLWDSNEPNKQTLSPSVYHYPRLIANRLSKIICMTCYTLYKISVEFMSRQTVPG